MGWFGTDSDGSCCGCGATGTACFCVGGFSYFQVAISGVDYISRSWYGGDDCESDPDHINGTHLIAPTSVGNLYCHGLKILDGASGDADYPVTASWNSCGREFYFPGQPNDCYGGLICAPPAADPCGSYIGPCASCTNLGMRCTCPFPNCDTAWDHRTYLYVTIRDAPSGYDLTVQIFFPYWKYSEIRQNNAGVWSCQYECQQCLIQYDLFLSDGNCADISGDMSLTYNYQGEITPNSAHCLSDSGRVDGALGTDEQTYDLSSATVNISFA